MPKRSTDPLTIGEVAERTGLAGSAVRFYEQEGLLTSERTSGNHRIFQRHVIRRLAFIRVAQQVGLSLDEIREALALLPLDQAPTKRQWEVVSRSWRHRLNEQIASLERLRDKLTNCIGCGCLSLSACKLSNPNDAAATLGEGPRYLMGDSADDLP